MSNQNIKPPQTKEEYLAQIKATECHFEKIIQDRLRQVNTNEADLHKSINIDTLTTQKICAQIKSAENPFHFM